LPHGQVVVPTTERFAALLMVAIGHDELPVNLRQRCVEEWDLWEKKKII
jgi:hypothetical protein